MPTVVNGIRNSIRHTWYEVYRLAFAALVNLTGPTADAGTMVIGTGSQQATWTLRNGTSALDTLNMASGKLVWDMSAVSTTTTLASSGGPLIRTLLKNLWGAFGAGGAPYNNVPWMPVRCACAIDATTIGDQNVEVCGMGVGLGSGSTGHGFMMETGFQAGAARTLWQSYSPSKQGTSIVGTNSALCLEVHASKAIPYIGTAIGAEPPELAVMRTTEWTQQVAMYLDAYNATAGVDLASPSNTVGNFILHASSGNTNNNFAPKHTGIAVAVPRRFVLT